MEMCLFLPQHLPYLITSLLKRRTGFSRQTAGPVPLSFVGTPEFLDNKLGLAGQSFLYRVSSSFLRLQSVWDGNNRKLSRLRSSQHFFKQGFKTLPLFTHFSKIHPFLIFMASSVFNLVHQVVVSLWLPPRLCS